MQGLQLRLNHPVVIFQMSVNWNVQYVRSQNRSASGNVGLKKKHLRWILIIEMLLQINCEVLQHQNGGGAVQLSSSVQLKRITFSTTLQMLLYENSMKAGGSYVNTNVCFLYIDSCLIGEGGSLARQWLIRF